MNRKGYTLEALARHKYPLRQNIAAEIGELRDAREFKLYSALFAVDAAAFKTSADHALVFDPQNYPYNQPYRGGRRFQKHYMPIIGDLAAEGEEFYCACYIDAHPKVRYWVRNLERKPNSFWLQLSHGRFFPDFVVMLTDGRILVVEYKGGHLYDGEEEKRRIGALWADAGGGLFVMPTEKRFGVIDQAIA